MFPSLKTLSLYLLTIVVFVGFQFLLQLYVFREILGAEFDLQDLFWQTGWAALIILSYNYYAILHVFVASVLFRIVIYDSNPLLITFSLSVIQTAVVAFYALLFRNYFKLNLRAPQVRDIFLFLALLIVHPFTAFWTSFLFLTILGRATSEPFPFLARWMASSTFSYTLIGPFFASIIVPLLDHFFIFHVQSLSNSIPSTAKPPHHVCFACSPPQDLPFLAFLFPLSIALTGFSFWLSQDVRFQWFVLSFFISFLFIPRGYYFTVFFPLSVFVASVLMLLFFGVFPTNPFSMALFTTAVSILVLFAAIYADDLKYFRRKSEQELNQKVEERTHQLSQSRQELIEALNSKTVLLSQIAHELSTPLHQVSTALELLFSSSLDVSQQNLTRTAISSTSTAFKRVDDLLFLARLESREENTLSEFNLIQMFDDVVSSVLDHTVVLIKFYMTEPISDDVYAVGDVSLVPKILELVLRLCLSQSSNVTCMYTYNRDVIETSPSPSLSPATASLVYEPTLVFSSDPGVVFETAVLEQSTPSSLLPLLYQLCDSSNCHVSSFPSDSQLAISFKFPISRVAESPLFSLLSSRFNSFCLITNDSQLSRYLSALFSHSLAERTFTNELVSREDCLFIVDEFTIQFELEVHPPSFQQLLFIGNTDRLNSIAPPVTPSRLFLVLRQLLSAEELPETSGPPVLVVDDINVNVTVLQSLLRSLGVTSDVAYNGLEAVNRVKQRAEDPYKLILMDIQMPVMDGIDATRTIRDYEFQSKIPTSVIVSLSAHAFDDPKSRHEMISAGFDDYIKKPLKKSRLQLCLSRALIRTSVPS
ncbi:hypothetical protein RCL1_001463 [Eukaryota sp. TZLM3-RCL]